MADYPTSDGMHGTWTHMPRHLILVALFYCSNACARGVRAGSTHGVQRGPGSTAGKATSVLDAAVAGVAATPRRWSRKQLDKLRVCCRRTLQVGSHAITAEC